MYLGPHVIGPYSCQLLMKLGLSRQIFEKSSNKFYENPSAGKRVFPCRWAEKQTWRS